MKAKQYHFEDIIGISENFIEVLQRAKKAAESSAYVFILGETGTGKELFAQSLHFASPRRDKPFVAQNCAAFPEGLLEGILFGTVKGGFTGALDRPGLFEQANGGTLLLDEVSAMPYSLQGKLLRVLQESYVRRIGDTKDIPIDVRIIAILNEDPKKLIESGLLRKDLYYRLKIIELAIPPLRERTSDILILAERFLEKYSHNFGKQIKRLSDNAKERLLDYDFPGNVRELENIIMSAVALSDDEDMLSGDFISISEEHHEEVESSEKLYNIEGTTLDAHLDAIEKRIIMKTLAESGGNISRTARRLGVCRQALQYKIKKHSNSK